MFMSIHELNLLDKNLKYQFVFNKRIEDVISNESSIKGKPDIDINVYLKQLNPKSDK